MLADHFQQDPLKAQNTGDSDFLEPSEPVQK